MEKAVYIQGNDEKYYKFSGYKIIIQKHTATVINPDGTIEYIPREHVESLFDRKGISLPFKLELIRED